MSLFSYLVPFAMDMLEMDERAEQRTVELRRLWKESANLPRKTKKKVRRGLLLDWQINEYYKQNLSLKSYF